MKYDDASWHHGAEDFPESSPVELGGVHIALFMKWCFQQGWAGEMHKETAAEDVDHVITDKMTATEFLFKYCDGKFTAEDLNNEGNKFAQKYYGDNGLYLDDCGRYFADDIYSKPESECDYSLFSTMLTERYSSGKLSKSFWKFWR